MKKILLITPLYPIPYPENNATDVCHSFAKEWVRQGYDVLVIHLQGVHCLAWHLLIKLFGRQIANRVGGGNFYSKRLRKTEYYTMDGVPIFRVPVYNFIPHGRFPKRSVQKFISEVLDILKAKDFVPDAITGHMLSLEIIPLLNEHLHSKTFMVEHGVPKKLKERYPDYEKLISSYTRYGFRSKGIQEDFERKICKVPAPFICYSGIPDYLPLQESGRTFEGPLSRFIYVGEFIRRKYPSKVVEALSKVYPDKGFSLTYVGEGPDREEIDSAIAATSSASSVRFSGKLPRKDIAPLYDEADCMVMISEHEAFGLVYLEAMARGCITIGARGEGIDGVIVDGVNGFLCPAGDADELASLIRRINGLTSSERLAISNAAIRTARRMTDSAVAEDYAELLLS